jgi:chemotaxis protein CheX
MATTETVFPDHTECVAQAAAQILSATCGVTIQPIEGEDYHTSGDAIIGVISLAGDVEWSLFLGLPSETAVAAGFKFAGFEIPFDSADMGDAVGELTNMLAGQVKMNLDQKGINADISLPSVIRAENMTVLGQTQNPIHKKCFASELGELWTGVTAGKQAA